MELLLVLFARARNEQIALMTSRQVGEALVQRYVQSMIAQTYIGHLGHGSLCFETRRSAN